MVQAAILQRSVLGGQHDKSASKARVPAAYSPAAAESTWPGASARLTVHQRPSIVDAISAQRTFCIRVAQHSSEAQAHTLHHLHRRQKCHSAHGGISVPSCRLYCLTNLISLTCVFSFRERIRNARPSRSSGRSSTSISVPSAAATCRGSITVQLHGGRRQSRLAGRKSVERCKMQAGAAGLCHQHVLQRSPRSD